MQGVPPFPATNMTVAAERTQGGTIGAQHTLSRTGHGRHALQERQAYTKGTLDSDWTISCIMK